MEIGKYCGTADDLRGSTQVLDAPVTLLFVSDRSANGDGFVINFAIQSAVQYACKHSIYKLMSERLIV